MFEDLTEGEMVAGHVMGSYCGTVSTPGSSYWQLLLAKKKSSWSGQEGPLLGISPSLSFTVQH